MRCRSGSPTRFKWYGAELSEANKKQLWIPKGFAHGFCVTSDSADFVYKCTEKYTPAHEHSIRWNDPALGIKWPVTGSEAIVTTKDAALPLLALARTPF